MHNFFLAKSLNVKIFLREKNEKICVTIGRYGSYSIALKMQWKIKITTLKVMIDATYDLKKGSPSWDDAKIGVKSYCYSHLWNFVLQKTSPSQEVNNIQLKHVPLSSLLSFVRVIH